MVSRGHIQEFVDRLVSRFQPDAVILFGSYAHGRGGEDSDVDLMVVMPHRGSGAAMATKMRLACPRDFPLDLVVRTPSEINDRLRMGDRFISEVISEGVVLHESVNARVG